VPPEFAPPAIGVADDAGSRCNELFPFRRACGGNGRGYHPAARNRSLYERMIMSGLIAYHNGGNGAQHHVPRSRRAFLKSISPRLAALEGAVEGLEDAVEALKSRPDAGEVKPVVSDPLLSARVDNLLEHVVKLAEAVRLVDGRSRRTRRRALALADQIAF
jgi:hypothetical protein